MIGCVSRQTYKLSTRSVETFNLSILLTTLLASLDPYQSYGAGVSSAFIYTHNEDEAAFSVVDNRSAAAKKASAVKAAGGQRSRPQKQQATRTGLRSTNQRFGNQNNRLGRQQGQNRRRFGWKDYDKVCTKWFRCALDQRRLTFKQ